MYYNLFDSHTHSSHSPDGEHEITYMCETAISKDLQGFATTDHLEGDGFDEWSYSTRIKQSELGHRIAKTAFGKTIIMTFGIEIAQVFYNLEAVEDLLAQYKFDFIIGSLHKLLYESFDFYLCSDYTAIPAEKLNEYVTKYFEELIDLINWGNFDVLGHITFPVRYPKLYNNIDVDFTRCRDIIDEVLKLAAGKGKGIEINTSGLRNAVNDTMPPMWILKRYKELGGEIVTIGSDAHKAGDLGEGIEYAMQMLKDAGYDYFAFYRERKPVMLRII